MEFYIYQADVYCPKCAEAIKRQALKEHGPEFWALYHEHKRTRTMVELWPQGPFDDEESDTPQHCARGGDCLNAIELEDYEKTEALKHSVGAFLEQPLTGAGYQYVIDAIAESLNKNCQLDTVLKLWRDFYGSDYFKPEGAERARMVDDWVEHERCPELPEFSPEETAEREALFAELDSDPAFAHYVTTMLWSTNDESDESGGVPLDSHYDREFLSTESLKSIIADCKAFKAQAGDMLLEHEDPAMWGHDFWLTRGGHGAGFWDGDWPENGDKLTALSKSFPEQWPCIGGNGLIYV